MKTHPITVFVISALSILGCQDKKQAEISQKLNDLRQIHLATQQYSLDILTTGNTSVPIFPESLDKLVEKNYLTELQLKTIIADSTVFFSKPVPHSPRNFVYLTLEDQNSQLSINLRGDIGIIKK